MRLSLLLLPLALLVSACGGSSTMDAAMADATPNLVETAASVDDLSTLVAAVQAGDLVETLSGPGPFTVFAPTNAAFDALPDGTVATLLEPANKSQLQGILTFHVVPGKLMASDLSDGQMLTTVNGAQLEVSISGGSVMIGGATVAMADVEASNGVAHVIDTVLL
ncbi:MAG: fasciclin domain-containing protein, partial [Bacteroidota bacterium]